MKKYLKIPLILLINLVLVALLLEVALRVVANRLPGALAMAAAHVITGELYSQTWTPAWQSNPDHYYILKPGIDNELQYGSPSVSFHLTTIELWDGGGVGFRTRPVDYEAEVVVVGDSFGMCFSEQADCWVEQLPGKFHPPLGVVNLSQPVTGSTSHGRILEDFGRPLEPNLVIWQFFGNDFNDDYGLSIFGDETAPPPQDDILVEPAPPLLDWLQRNSVAFAVLQTVITGQIPGLSGFDRLFVNPYSVRIGDTTMRFGAQYEQRAMDMSLERNQTGLALSRQAFEKAQQTVTEWGGSLAFVIIPTREEVYAALTEPVMGKEALDKLRSSRQAMLQLCDELELSCYDPLPDFQTRAQAHELLYYTDDMHLNPHGNAVLGEALAAWLVEQGYIESERKIQ